MLLEHIVVIFLMVSLFSCGAISKYGEVKVSGHQISVSEAQYTIKGICYHPVPKGKDKRSFENLNEDLALMAEAGINTISLYEPIIEKAVLDEIDQAGLKGIIGFGYDKGGENDMLSGSFITHVHTFENHSAILMRELGNEYDYDPEWFEGDINNWYRSLNQSATDIHEVAKKHPITTALVDMPDALALNSCPDKELWGMKVYRWIDLEELFEQWKTVSTKPMYLSEADGDSYMTIAKSGYEKGKQEKAQADAKAANLDVVFKNQEIATGATLFSFTDGRWKAGDTNEQDPGDAPPPNSNGVPYDGSPNEEYWGIVEIERNKKQKSSAWI